MGASSGFIGSGESKRGFVVYCQLNSQWSEFTEFTAYLSLHDCYTANKWHTLAGALETANIFTPNTAVQQRVFVQVYKRLAEQAVSRAVMCDWRETQSLRARCT